MNKNNIIGGTLKLKTNPNKTSVALREIKKVIQKGEQKNKKNELELASDKILSGESEYVKEIQKHEELMEIEARKKIEENKSKVFNINNFIDNRTAAEKRFSEIQERRLLNKIEHNTQSTFKEKFEKFNKNLSKIPEHYDIPKVGPG